MNFIFVKQRLSQYLGTLSALHNSYRGPRDFPVFKDKCLRKDIGSPRRHLVGKFCITSLIGVSLLQRFIFMITFKNKYNNFFMNKSSATMY